MARPICESDFSKTQEFTGCYMSVEAFFDFAQMVGTVLA